MNAPVCDFSLCCREDASVTRACLHFCTAHMRKLLASGSTIDEFRPLLRPLMDYVVLLRIEPKAYESKGLVIIPESARDKHGRIKGDEAALGYVMAVGPGEIARTKGPRSPFAVKNGEAVRSPMNSRVGRLVVFRNVYDPVCTEWRGLTIVHDFDVLGEAHEDAGSDALAAE